MTLFRTAADRQALITVLDSLFSRLAEQGDLTTLVPSDDHTIQTLLTISRYGQLRSRHRTLNVLLRLPRIQENPCLQAEAIYETSVVLRLDGDIAGSSKLLRDFFDQCNRVTLLESQPVLGRLRLSQAANHIYNCDYELAHAINQTWIPSPSMASPRMLDVVWSQMHLAGNIYRGEGQFEQARRCYEVCLKAQDLRKSKRLCVLSQLTDIYVELDYQNQVNNILASEDLLASAKKHILPFLEHLRIGTTCSKGFRRLLLSLAEIEMRLHHREEAKKLLEEADSLYKNLSQLDIIDRLGHLRVYIGLARLSPRDEKELAWWKALEIGRKHHPQDEKVFVVALIYLYIARAQLCCNKEEESKLSLRYATKVRQQTRPSHLIPGTGTYLLHSVQEEIRLHGPWDSDTQCCS